MRQLKYIGFIKEVDNGFFDDSIAIGDTEDTLVYTLSDEGIEGKQVGVRYWLSDKEMTESEIKEQALLSLVGAIGVDTISGYSEYTILSNDELVIGGHDLLYDLAEHVGKFVLLEIDIHEP